MLYHKTWVAIPPTKLVKANRSRNSGPHEKLVIWGTSWFSPCKCTVCYQTIRGQHFYGDTWLKLSIAYSLSIIITYVDIISHISYITHIMHKYLFTALSRWPPSHIYIQQKAGCESRPLLPFKSASRADCLFKTKELDWHNSEQTVGLTQITSWVTLKPVRNQAAEKKMFWNFISYASAAVSYLFLIFAVLPFSRPQTSKQNILLCSTTSTFFSSFFFLFAFFLLLYLFFVFLFSFYLSSFVSLVTSIQTSIPKNNWNAVWSRSNLSVRKIISAISNHYENRKLSFSFVVSHEAKIP